MTELTQQDIEKAEATELEVIGQLQTAQNAFNQAETNLRQAQHRHRMAMETTRAMKRRFTEQKKVQVFREKLEIAMEQVRRSVGIPENVKLGDFLCIDIRAGHFSIDPVKVYISRSWYIRAEGRGRLSENRPRIYQLNKDGVFSLDRMAEFIGDAYADYARKRQAA